LEGLGYRVVPAISHGRFQDLSWRPGLRLVDERHHELIPSERLDPITPLILVTGPRPLAIQDSRITGRVSAPLQLDQLYPLVQRAMETTPRSLPRAATKLAARCTRRDQRSVGQVVSLSEGGCLFRSAEPIQPGTQMNLQFALPRWGLVATRAECVHSGRAGAGLRFTAAAPEARHHIADFVAQRLASA
jgi:hypothetical protein